MTVAIEEPTIIVTSPSPSPAPSPAPALEGALRMAKRGFRVFPCRPAGEEYVDQHGVKQISDGKRPDGSWMSKATTNETTIRKRFERKPDRNYGMAMGDQLPDGRYLFAIDVDMKRGPDDQLLKNGEASLAALCERVGVERSYLLGTLIQLTPSGQRPDGTREGGHLIYSTSRPFKGGTNTLGPGLDTRGIGGYIIGPGSVIEGRAYVMPNPNAPILELPEAIEALLAAAPEKRIDRKPQGPVDAKRAEARAIAYLSGAPHAIEGQGGDTTTYLVAARLKDFGVTQDQAVWLLDEHWNERCEPPWSLEDLAVKVGNAYRYGQEQPGSSAPEIAFPPVEEPEPEEKKIHPFAELNREFAFVLVGGTSAVLWETVDEYGKPFTDFIKLQAFHDLHAAKTFSTGKRTQPLTKAWMEWTGRRTYKRISFAPGRQLPEDSFNLWRGFPIEPRQGNWAKMRAHIKDVICGGDVALDGYVMGWLARAVQKPGERGEVALVLRGMKGTGKGTLGHWMRRIFGRHGLHISQARHLIGNFNHHLREAAYLFCDEAFFAGDKQHESVLKAMITEPTLVIESKGVDAVSRDNCLHILMASNSDWVIPATADERRFCVVDVLDTRMQDFAYFKALEMERDSGGLEAMLFDLLAYDLSEFEVRDIPRTQGLTDQKVASLHGANRWLKDALTDEEVLGSSWGSGNWETDRLSLPTKKAIYDDYCRKSKDHYREHHPQDSRWFWRVVLKAIPVTEEKKNTDKESKKQIKTIIFPPLAEARKAFEKSLGGKIDWGDPPEAVDIFS